MKVAKLVTVSVTTRVVVEDNANDEEIMEAAIPRLISSLKGDGVLDHFESIENDKEMPFGSKDSDKQFPKKSYHENSKFIKNVPVAKSEAKYIYGVDTHEPIKVSANVHNLLIEEELIQYDGTEWMYFEAYTDRIKEVQRMKGK
jgi:hypothetical protein